MFRAAPYRKPRLLALVATGLALALATTLSIFASGPAAAHTINRHPAKPTIVLVHGAWANTASWNGVITRLESKGYPVFAPPNPLLSLQGDAETIADFVKSIPGPVVLVGHSYGGAVITNAANSTPNVKALVYVDAFAPAQGESAFQLTALDPGSVLTSAPQTDVFRAVSYAGAQNGDQLVYVNPKFFATGFANDLNKQQTALAQATQDPVALSAVQAPSGAPAWAHIPSWYAIGTVDKAIPPAAQEFMAKRAGSHITTIRGAGHLSMVSHPAEVARVITQAAQTIG